MSAPDRASGLLFNSVPSTFRVCVVNCGPFRMVVTLHRRYNSVKPNVFGRDQRPSALAAWPIFTGRAFVGLAVVGLLTLVAAFWVSDLSERKAFGLSSERRRRLPSHGRQISLMACQTSGRYKERILCQHAKSDRYEQLCCGRLLYMARLPQP